tara:strand:- start:10482 stop:11633 length:1152 start_codon:yes stop_codon:yes gene_type:complete
MKINKIEPSFTDETKTLCVVLTVSNWDEAPRMRHAVTNQLVRKFNVLYVQLFQKKGVKRRQEKINDNLIIVQAGFGFPGIGRIFKYLPILHGAYNKLIAKQIRRKIKSVTSTNSSILINFQYDFPEINAVDIFTRKIYYCNDDFVNQDVNSSKAEVARKDDLQARVVKGSTEVITVSYPLQEQFAKYGKKTHVILSGHNFDLNISRNFAVSKDEIIKVCYLGFLNSGIAIDWLKYILENNKIYLTVIGPIEVPGFREFIEQASNAKHIEFLTGNNLQFEMLKHDVLLMPYSSPVANAVTTVPAKLFQYLAVGKPIVSSSLQNLISLPDGFVYKSESKESFLKNILVSNAADNDGARNDRIEYSALHTWDARGNELFKVLDLND